MLRFALFAIFVFSPVILAHDSDNDRKHGKHAIDDHHAVTPSPAQPPADDWRKYVPPEYQHYIPEQLVPDHRHQHQPAHTNPNEDARAHYDPSYDQYGHKQHDHDDDDHDKHHDKKHDKDHEDHDKKHDKHDKHHDKKDKHHKHDQKDKHHDKHDKHDNDKKHNKHDKKHDKHSKKHSKHSLADVDEINEAYEEGLYFSRDAEVDRSIDDSMHDEDVETEKRQQSTWSWFGMIALFLIGAVIALVILYWIAACVVAYLHRRRYDQLEQNKNGQWADEESIGIKAYTRG